MTRRHCLNTYPLVRRAMPAARFKATGSIPLMMKIHRYFTILGLMDGDIVVSINDIRLDNPNKASQAFEKLIASDSIELTVLSARVRQLLWFIT